MIEEWRAIPGFEGYYEVSDQGRVKSLARTVQVSGRARRIDERILKNQRHSAGYRSVQLYGKGRTLQMLVHRLVLITFVGLQPDGMEACHNNGDRSDSALTNLRWDTRSANNLDAVSHGTHPWARRTKCPQGHSYDEANTYIYRGKRSCIACHQVAAASSALRKKLERTA